MNMYIFIILFSIICVSYFIYTYRNNQKREVDLWKNFIISMSQEGRILDKDDKPMHITEINMTDGTSGRPNLKDELNNIYNDNSYIIRITYGHFSIERKPIEINVKIENKKDEE